MHPRTRTIVITLIALAGTALLLVFLDASLRPNEKPRPKLPHANVTDLSPRHYITVETESLRYFVVQTTADNLHVVAVPIEDGKVLMPDTHWWKPLFDCKDFGLDATNGTINNESRFHCRDDIQPAEWILRWQWNTQGKHISDKDNSPVDDMYRVRFKRDGNEIEFTGLEQT